MIFVTGDTHGMTDFGKLLFFAKNHQGLTKKDYVIIAGDFYLTLTKENLEEQLKPYRDLPFSILFVDGNHENFGILNSYPIEMWNGGKVHKLYPDIIHLMRGQVFTIEGAVFFTFGGATSTDKDYRIVRGLQWWEEERPTYEEFDEGIENLKKVNNTVDFIITHSCSQKTLMYPDLRGCEAFFENQMLLSYEDIINYKHWYFGHYHMDKDINSKQTVLYQDVRRIV